MTELERICQAVAAYYRVEESAVRGRGQAPSFKLARLMLYFIAYRGGYTYAAIGRFCDSREHSSILQAYRRMQEDMDTYAFLVVDLNAIKEALIKQAA